MGKSKVQVPDGFVLVSDYDTREPGEFKNTGGTGVYAQLLKAVRKKSNRIRHYRDSGKIVANKADTDAYLARASARPDRSSENEPAAKRPLKPSRTDTAMLDYAADIRASLSRCVAHLGDIFAVLARVATAAEQVAEASQNIATQPKTPQQELLATLSGNGTWRDMNGESH